MRVWYWIVPRKKSIHITVGPQTEYGEWVNTLQAMGMSYHIEAETKWPPFSRQHFQMDFREWKCMNFD